MTSSDRRAGVAAPIQPVDPPASFPERPATPAKDEPRVSDRVGDEEKLDRPRKAEEKADRKRRKKEERFLRDQRRPLDSWERYRTLTDTLEEAHDLVDLADHKARFALLIMGALNAVLFIVATRSEVVDAIPVAFRPVVGAYFLVYALLALFFFMQAIESLRPRKATPSVPYPGETGLEEHPMGLRFYEDALRRDLQAYRRAWREVRIGQVNAELAIQAHTLARINQAKYKALQRLYLGLQIMTLMAAGLITAGAYAVFRARVPDGTTAEAAAARTADGGGTAADVLGKPQRLADSGVKEPSGVAYHAGLQRLFVVGDEGRLAELDREGRVVGSYKFKGNLEDVAVHTPSGYLLLLSERKSELVVYDPRAHQERRSWRIDSAAILGREPGDKNQGFEGVAFREQPGEPGGGVFYLVHQRTPAMIVAVSFDPLGSGEAIGAEAVRGRWSLKGYKDLTAVTWVPSLGSLLVISDAKDRLLVVGTDGALQADVGLPGTQQEGVGVDAVGDLWVADDRGGLLRFRGALQALESRLSDEGR